MFNFTFYTPTKVVFGKGAEAQVGELVKAQNCKKVLLHYGSGSVKKSGLLDKVKSSLDAEKISYVELGGVVPNPRLSLVRTGIELAKKEGIDFILAVGGGSVIDSSKAIGYGVANEGDVWDFYDRKRVATACLPIGVVLTIAAAGSEMSNSSVITKDEGAIKRGCTNDICRPRFAVMNPELTMTLPDYQTACGCTDIILHTMERYFVSTGHMEISTELGEGVIRTVMNNAKILCTDPKNYEARAEIMWAGSLSHNNVTGCGIEGRGDWACHQLEHEVSGMFDVAHGAGLAAIWGTWARYVYKSCLPRFKRYAIKVMGVAENGSDEEIALKGIEATENFFRSIKMPTNLRELGVTPTEEQIKELAQKCSIANAGKIGNAKVLTENDMIAIYKAAL